MAIGPGGPVDGVHMAHVGAILDTEGLEIVGLFDPDPAARDAARAILPEGPRARVGAGLDELEPGAATIVVLCTPPEGRLALVESALAKDPRVLVVEKPFATTLDEAHRVADRIDDSSVTARVNFRRAFDRRHREASARLGGATRAVVVRYSGGLRNYSSHVVDLLLDWFGPVVEVQALGSDLSGEDPRLSYRCRMEAGFDAWILGMEGLGYDQFEIDVYGENRRVELANGGVEINDYEPVDDRYYPGYRQLGAPRTTARPVGGFSELYAALRDHLVGGGPLPGCDHRRAVAGIAVIEAACRSARAAGRAVDPRALTGR